MTLSRLFEVLFSACEFVNLIGKSVRRSTRDDQSDAAPATVIEYGFRMTSLCHWHGKARTPVSFTLAASLARRPAWRT